MASFAIESFLGDSNVEFEALDGSDRTSVLESTCGILEKKLADMDYLAQFTWNGMQAFYDDDPNDFNRFSRKGFSHLKDEFTASIDPSETVIYLWNTKTVNGKRGSINLFDQLLWPKFGSYRVPHTDIGNFPEEMAKYYGRSQKMQRRMNQLKRELTEQKPMTFYYRYEGKRFFNVMERGGMNDSLHEKFKEYIHKAIRESLKEAILEKMGENYTKNLESMYDKNSFWGGQ